MATTRYTYTDAITNERSVVPILDLISSKDVPFLKLIGGGTDDRPALNSLSKPCTAMKYEWLEDQDTAMTLTMTSTAALNTTGNLVGTTTTTAAAAAGLGLLTSGQGVRLRVGDLLKVDATGEVMWVTYVDTTNDLFAATRGIGDTTNVRVAATASATTAMTVVGRAHAEGTDAVADYVQVPTAPYNYVQEMTGMVTVTELEQSINRYGIEDKIERDTRIRTRELFRRLERNCLFGFRQAGTSTSVPSTMGGLSQYINSTAGNITAVGGAVTKAVINTRLRDTLDMVGMANMPDTLVVSPLGRSYINTCYGTATNGQITVYRDQNDPIGGFQTEMLRTDVGVDLQIVTVNDLPNISSAEPYTVFYFLKKDKIGVGPLVGREFKRTMLAKTGTSDKWQISGAYTMEVRGSLCHAALTGVRSAA